MSVVDKLRNQSGDKPHSSRPKFFKVSKDLWLAALVAVVIITAGVFIGWDNNQTIPKYPKPSYHYRLEPHNPLSFMANWDAVDYLTISEHGYTNLFWVNWFPLYPLTIHAVNQVIPSALDSALLISWGSLVGAIYLYMQIVRRLFKVTGDYEPIRAVTLFVLFPTAIFLIAPFSESLYALLALASIYFALQKKWLPAALAALLCTATHITGMFVVVLAALILLEQKARLRDVILTLIVGSLGLVSYMWYLQVYFHKPLGFLQSQQIYHGWTHNGLANLVTSISLSNAIFIILIILSAIYWWQRQRRSFAVYSLLFLAIPLVGRQYGGFNRYVLMAFPVQLMLYGYLRDKNVLYTYATIVLGMAWTYFLLQYAGGYIGS